MATVTVGNREVEKVVKTIEKTYTLELTETEARVLVSHTGHAIPTTTSFGEGRSASDASYGVYRALRDAGVATFRKDEVFDRFEVRFKG